MKTTSLLCAVLSATGLFAATPTVTSVTARQRYPWNGKVDIVVTFAGASNDVATATCTFTATNTTTAAALTISHIERMGNDSGSDNVWTRHYVWDATADVGEVKIADVVINVEAAKPLGGVQLWKDGPYWAECNVGASKPEEYGYYFWWGDTVGYKRNASNDGWVSVKDGTAFGFNDRTCPTYGMGNTTLQSQGYIDSSGNLAAAHDAATAHLGAPWRMPTDAEMAALISNCTTTWITTNGVSGRLVTGKGDYSSKSIFLPAAGLGDGSDLSYPGSIGCYRSSAPSSYSSHLACYLYFSSSYFSPNNDTGRYYGQSVRSLREFAKSVTAIGGLNAASTHLALDTRTGTRYARAEEPIAFSTDWREGVTRLVLNVDGANVLTATSATNGVYVWTPDFSSVRTVTLKHTTRAPSSNEVLTATFTVEAFDVTFSPGTHGSFAEGAVTSQRVPYGADALVPTVIPAAGYLFTGWSASPSNITADASCVACYAAIAYPITYTDLHGATHTNPDTYTIEDAVTFAAPQSLPRRQFVRWEPSALTVGTTGPVTVRAVWETTPYVYVDAANGDDARDGSTAELAVKTLERAYALAEAGDIIWVAAGTYDPVTVTGKAVTFRATDGATIDGGGTTRCVTADEDVVFENFTLANGYDGEAGGGAMGGTFDGCTITNCVSAWDGGGAYESILRNCVIVGNAAENGWGGGAYGCTLINCKVVDNQSGDEGGGVYAPESIQDTTFRGNSPENVAGDDGKVTAGTSYVYEPFGSESAYSISYDWFVVKGLAKVGDASSGLDAKLEATHANGRTGWESFVAGLDPTIATSEFTAMVTLSNGQVYVSWSPNLNDGKASRIYTVYGRTALGSGDWETPANDGHKFFMVEVAMMEGGAESDVPGPLPKPLGGVQLWANGPYWAECNVGASKPEEYGYYFWWGDTVGYKRNASNDGWVSVKDGTAFVFNDRTCPTYGMGNTTLQSQGYIDSTGNLVAAHDAATAHLGAPWRMPTDAEMAALKSNCTTTWITTNGVYGCLVSGKGDYASKSIFLPAAGNGFESDLYRLGSYGYYWSSTPNSGDFYGAWSLYFDSGNFSRSNYYYRYIGQSVRPLREFAK